MKYKKFKKSEEFILFIKENRRRIIIISLASLILMIIQCVKDNSFDGKYLQDKDGNIVGIIKNSSDEPVCVPIEYKATKDGETCEKDQLLYIASDNGEPNIKETRLADSELLEEDINNAVDQIEKNKEETIIFPTVLENGTVIKWLKPGKKFDFTFLMFIPILIILMYKDRQNKIHKKELANINSVKKTLPVFNSQLLLLLNSGLIFNDAFVRIARGYNLKDNPNYFEKLIYEIYIKSLDTNSSLILLLNEYSKVVEVKEFSRLITIISDNQYKGVNLNGKLEAESVLLWEERKKNAEETGKLAETRLTFPLAVLLLVLIIITAAPAILQI